MVAYDSRRALVPTQILGPQAVAALRAALAEQRVAGSEPTAALSTAVAAAAHEARARQLQPEALLIQLKGLADEIGIRPTDQTPTPPSGKTPHIREWMVGALLRAYWQLPD